MTNFRRRNRNQKQNGNIIATHFGFHIENSFSEEDDASESAARRKSVSTPRCDIHDHKFIQIVKSSSDFWGKCVQFCFSVYRSHIFSTKAVKILIKMITEDPKGLQRPDDYRPTEVKSVFHKRRQETLNLNGWGFTDSIFVYNKGQLTFTGERYFSKQIFIIFF